MDGDHFSVIMSHLRHKMIEPNAFFSSALVKPERRGQFEAMLDFLGLRKFFDNTPPCGCKVDCSNQNQCSYCSQVKSEVFLAQPPNPGYRMCRTCHLQNCPGRKR